MGQSTSSLANGKSSGVLMTSDGTPNSDSDSEYTKNWKKGLISVRRSKILEEISNQNSEKLLECWDNANQMEEHQQKMKIVACGICILFIVIVMVLFFMSGKQNNSRRFNRS